jgi:SHS2 domain-containing protein
MAASVQYFEHTADVGMRARAASLSELFAAMASGLFGYIVANAQAIEPRKEEAVELESCDPATLLVAWLNELIFRSETEHRLYARFDVEVLVSSVGASLRGTIAGEPLDFERHEVDHEVKAATHHGLNVGRSGHDWVAEVILDI